MNGQPVGFSVGRVISTEPVGATAPAVVVKLNDSITLKTYLHVDASVQSILKNAINTALTGQKVEYHLQDLETGAMLTIDGKTIVKLPPADVAVAFGTAPGPATTAGVIAGELRDSGLSSSGDYYLSPDTDDITTGIAGSGAKLELSTATSVSGTWRILTHAHGAAGSEVSAFDDDLVITVIT